MVRVGRDIVAFVYRTDGDGVARFHNVSKGTYHLYQLGGQPTRLDVRDVTDEQAVEEAREHIEYLFNVLFTMKFPMYFPPGYTSRESFKRVMAGKSQLAGGKRTIEALRDHGVIIVGSPETVRRRFTEYHRDLGMGHVICHMQFGTLPADLTRKNMDLFAREVMPALQASHIEQPELVAAE